MSRFEPKPPWLKVRAPGGETYQAIKSTLRTLDLHTVCEEARCPNVGECWREGTATVMLLGDVCTRGCRFCAVTTGSPRGAVDVREPEHVARAIARMGLAYVVLTMVNRDDLLDGGAEHVATTVRRLHALRPDILIEALVGDFCGRLGDVATVVAGAPDVFAHNVEVVRSQTRALRDARASFDQSLAVLRHAKACAPERPTKSSIMVGVGETDEEVFEALAELRAAGVDIVTIGQYLRPSDKHHPIARFVEPATFAVYEARARELGFAYAACGPLVRSSYRAAEVFVRSALGRGGAAAPGATVEERLAEAERGAAAAAAGLATETAAAVGLVPADRLRRPAERTP
ncbi:MAG: lipoyl synthase [Polyangiaceae bacterium]|nr:lipoyl synthase [Polyangiaceae bacterium]